MSSILIVEDEALLAMEIKEELEELGYSVPAVCSSGDEAITNVLSHMPDLVLMDIYIEGEKDGIEIAHYISDNFSIPVVYLTAYSDKNTISKVKLSNAYGYLLKPFNEASLQATVEMALNKSLSDRSIKKKEIDMSNILKSIHGGIIVSDFKGKIEFINDLGAKILSWDKKEIKGKSLYNIFKLYNNSNEKVSISYENVILNGSSVKESNLLLEDKNSNRKNINFNIAPFKNNNDVNSGLIVFFYEL